MVKAEMLQLVKDNLKLQTEDYDLAIMDLIQDCCSYCNLEELPNALESFVRKKIKRMIARLQGRHRASCCSLV